MDAHTTTTATIIRNASRISARVLETLDEGAPQYFDLCEEESTWLQNRLEERIAKALESFAEDLDEVHI